jgi:hypothetical protein
MKNPVHYIFFLYMFEIQIFEDISCVDCCAFVVRCSNLLWIYKQGKATEQLWNEDQQEYLAEEYKSCFYSSSFPHSYKLFFWSLTVCCILNLCLTYSWYFMTFCMTSCWRNLPCRVLPSGFLIIYSGKFCPLISFIIFLISSL